MLRTKFRAVTATLLFSLSPLGENNVSAQEAESEHMLESTPTVPLASSAIVAVSYVDSNLMGSELAQWVSDYQTWAKWDKYWFNRIARDNYGNVARERRVRPKPPAWLGGECAGLLEGEELLAKACKLWQEYLEDYLAVHLRQETAAVAVAEEAITKTVFWERVHVDALWPITNTGAFKYGGLVGIHLTLIDLGRLELFGLPGFMLMSLPDGRGGRQLKPGADLGLSVRLIDFRAPRAKQLYSLHLNLANVWTSVDSGFGFGLKAQMSIAGLSITLKKNR